MPSPGALLSQPTLGGKRSRINPTKSTSRMKRGFRRYFRGLFLLLLAQTNSQALSAVFSYLLSSITHRKWSRKRRPTSPSLSLSLSPAHKHSPPEYLLAPSPGLHLSEVKLCHLAMASRAFSVERKVQIICIDFRKHYFVPDRKKWVGKWDFLVFHLWTGFHFCCSNLQAGNRGLGHCDIFSLQGGKKRWMLPSGDMLLHLILERKKFVISLETCAKEFYWFWPCKLTLALIHQIFIFHINAVPWLHTLSRHCTICAGIDFTLKDSLWRVSHKEIRRWFILCCNELHIWCIGKKTCVLFLPCAFWLYLHAVLQTDPHLVCQCRSSWKLC